MSWTEKATLPGPLGAMPETGHDAGPAFCKHGRLSDGCEGFALLAAIEREYVHPHPDQPHPDGKRTEQDLYVDRGAGLVFRGCWWVFAEDAVRFWEGDRAALTAYCADGLLRLLVGVLGCCR